IRGLLRRSHLVRDFLDGRAASPASRRYVPVPARRDPASDPVSGAAHAATDEAPSSPGSR
ncbi:hypothetical protein, partial [uncultured Maricaulis sp.]